MAREIVFTALKKLFLGPDRNNLKSWTEIITTPGKKLFLGPARNNLNSWLENISIPGKKLFIQLKNTISNDKIWRV